MREDVHRAGTLDHEFLEPGLFQLFLAYSAIGGDCVGAEKRAVEGHSGKRSFRQEKASPVNSLRAGKVGGSPHASPNILGLRHTHSTTTSGHRQLIPGQDKTKQQPPQQPLSLQAPANNNYAHHSSNKLSGSAQGLHG